MRRTQFTNRAYSRLNGSINGTTTSVAVDDASTFPTEGDFFICVDNEPMKVTSVSGNVFTVVRGSDEILAVAHNNDAYVFAIVTRDQMNLFGSDFYDQGNFGWGNQLSDNAGIKLDDTDFTNLNFGTSSKGTDDWGAIYLTAQGATSNDFRLMTRTQPATPYTIVAHVDIGLGGFWTSDAIDGKAVGIGFLDASTEEISVLTITKEDSAAFNHWDTYDGFLVGTEAGSIDFYGRSDCWMKITNDGTTLEGFVSVTAGNTWRSLGTVTIDANMTPDKVFFGAAHGTSGQDAPCKLLAWFEIED